MLGASPESAQLLKSAWQDLRPARREQLIKLAAELFGAGFTKQLQ